MPANLKKLTEDSGYTYLRVRQLCKMFVVQGLIYEEQEKAYEYKLTERGKTVVELLDKVYSQLEN
jgi:predicted transcriptional regulator